MELKEIWQRIRGGWRTWGGTIPAGYAAGYDSGSSDGLYESVGASTALKIAAVWACASLRAETFGTLPFRLYDQKRNRLEDHDVAWLLGKSPNAYMVAADFWSLNAARVDFYGNAFNLIERNGQGVPIAINPIDNEEFGGVEQRRSGALIYKLGGEEYSAEQVLHLRGFGLNGILGESRLRIANQILYAQITANQSAMRAFKQGLKVGGFFEMAENLTVEQKDALRKELDRFGLPENNGKWMALYKGMKPIAGSQFRVTPVEAELLQSRHFGIEEICRVFNTPPQLIGHTDKASSWASSLENTNMFFLTYSLRPNLVRNEQTIARQLLKPLERRKLTPKFTVEGLLRTDTATRTKFYESGLRSGYLNQDEVREMEDRADIPDGEGKIFRVALNMSNTEETDKKEPNNGGQNQAS